MTPVYKGCFADYDDMRSAFGKSNDDTFPTPESILYANYNAEDYEGYAFVLFKRGDTLYEVNASHCSCYGLSESGYGSNDSDSQWDPEETDLGSLKMRPERWEGLDEVLDSL